jgi:hypothetical protein
MIRSEMAKAPNLKVVTVSIYIRRHSSNQFLLELTVQTGHREIPPGNCPEVNVVEPPISVTPVVDFSTWESFGSCTTIESQ